MNATVFSGSQLRVGTVRSSVGSRSTVVVRAVQDLQGRVVSTSMQNSVVVAVERLSPHDKYFKRVRITKKYTAHDDGSLQVGVGDYVRLEGCRPLSKTKRFKLAEVIRKAE
eukprot:GHUV01001867.1.p2 GENE.GHUV01001867.1~~GHUV01001867.1.p2  ORF type:complete len:111 (+),score=18.84 GHUV01001867.1:107-439(+)